MEYQKVSHLHPYNISFMTLDIVEVVGRNRTLHSCSYATTPSVGQSSPRRCDTQRYDPWRNLQAPKQTWINDMMRGRKEITGAKVRYLWKVQQLTKNQWTAPMKGAISMKGILRYELWQKRQYTSWQRTNRLHQWQGSSDLRLIE